MRTSAKRLALSRASSLLAAAVGSLLAAPPTLHADPLDPGTDAWRSSSRTGVRGVTVGPIESTLQPGRGYGTEHSEILLDELARLGVNWISITPFGRLWSLRSTTIKRDFEAPYAENRVAVRRMIEQAHARNMRVLVTPLIWVETGGWPGEVDPGNPDRWSQFHASYRRFIVAWAEDAGAARADAFTVGIECKSWSGRFGNYWRSLIGDVRRVFDGLVTYGANWDEAHDVIFWDELDVIGINAYYQLAQEGGASDNDYRRGAEANVESVQTLASVIGKPVWFTEVGSMSFADAATRPWFWPEDFDGEGSERAREHGMAREGPIVVDEREQARAITAVYGAFIPHTWFAGAFLWRYYASIDDVSQEPPWGFSPHGKEAERRLQSIHRERYGVDPEPLW